MQLRGDHARRRRGVVRALLVSGISSAAVATGLALAPGASASALAAPALADVEVHLPAGKVDAVSTKSASSGGYSGDFTLDGVQDILARDARNGQLKVYPHSGAFQGTATFRPAVTINYGWSSIRWIGQGDLSADGISDVIYVDQSGVMRVAQHRGSFSGPSTLLSGVVIGTGWGINDLIFTDDYDGDGYLDILARRAGTTTTYLYLNNGGLNGTATFAAPEAAVTFDGSPGDIRDQITADFTGDGLTDLIFLQSNGYLGLFDWSNGETYLLGYGWGAINAITLSNVDVSGLTDVIGRRASDGRLQTYLHSGSWAPQADGTAYSTLRAPQVLGYNWQINNVIV